MGDVYTLENDVVTNIRISILIFLIFIYNPNVSKSTVMNF